MKILNLFLATFLLFSHSRALNLNEICYGILFEAIPHPDDRNLFIGCVQGRGTVFGCENIDDVFDPESVSCVDPNSLTTTTQPPETPLTTSTTTITTEETTTEITTPESTSTPTLPPTTTLSIATTTPGGGIGITFVCPTDGSHALIPSSTNCDRFFECLLGVANMRFCPTGLHFDVFTRTCMEPALAFCANLIRCE
jgi:hypothetical protein